MGAIISFFFSSPKPVRTLMLGLDAAGKTTILYKLKLGEVVSSIPTIGFNVEQITYGSLHMSVWDIGGQDRIRKLWKFYFSGTDLLIFVVDSNDDSRLEEARAELHQLMKEDELRNAVLLVYANKMDLPHALSVSEIADRLKLRDLKQRHLVQATSASTGNGLYEGLEWAANELKTQKKSGVY